MKFLESLLYQASTALLIPVMCCILFCALWLIVQSGQTLGIFVDRRFRKLKSESSFLQQLELIAASATNGELAEIDIVEELRIWESKQQRSLRFLRLAIKAGPTLGLMGTLIPMGSALASLSQGDMMVMSVNMVTAFTTTIIGLACGLLAYVLLMIRQNWFATGRLACELAGEKALVRIKATLGEKVTHGVSV